MPLSTFRPSTWPSGTAHSGTFAETSIPLASYSREGPAYDLVIAAALGDLERVRGFLDEDPARIAEARPSGKHALSSAVEFGHHDIVRLLLDRGADPNWPDGANAPVDWRCTPPRAGDRPIVELLLAAGADPNSHLNSAGNATYVARTPELRALLFASGGTLDPYDLVWLGEDDEAVRRVAADPASANAGCGGVLAAASTQGKRDLLVRLLDAGARVPPVVNDCRSYLFSEPEMLRLLLTAVWIPTCRTGCARRPCTTCALATAAADRGRIVSNARKSCSTPVRRSRQRTRITVRPRSHGLPATTYPTWLTFCSPAARPPTCRMTNPGPRLWHGRPGADTTASPRSSAAGAMA